MVFSHIQEINVDNGRSGLQGFAMSLRALQPSLAGKMKGAWNIFGMRSIDTVMKKTAPIWWYERKKKKVFENADRELRKPAVLS